MSASARTPSRVLALVAPVIVAGVAAIGAAAFSVCRRRPTRSRTSPHSLGLFIGMVVAERFPVPVEGVDAGGVTLGFVFAVAAVVLFGWQAGVIMSAAAARRHPPRRAPAAPPGRLQRLDVRPGGARRGPRDHGRSSQSTVVAPARAGRSICAFLYNWVVNLVLDHAPSSRLTSGKPFFKLMRDNARQTTAPFALMASAALMLVVLWERSPALSVALVGPLLAIALYQRSTFTALKAMRLALTDPLTGLGNHRHFHERLQRELAAAEEDGLTLLALPRRHRRLQAHQRPLRPPGRRPRASARSRRRLRQGGESFRLGGDEFAVLLPGLDEPSGDRGRALDRRARRRPSSSSRSARSPSAPASRTYPAARRRARRADPPRGQRALLGEGGRQEPGARTYAAATSSSCRELQQLAEGPDRAARYRAAAIARAGGRRARRLHAAATRSASASSPRDRASSSASTSRRSS